MVAASSNARMGKGETELDVLLRKLFSTPTYRCAASRSTISSPTKNKAASQVEYCFLVGTVGGLGNPAMVKELREMAKKYAPSVLCVLETKFTSHV